MTDVFSVAGPPYTEPGEEETDTVKMVPFINLGESAPIVETPEPAEPELMFEKIRKEVTVTETPELPTTTEAETEAEVEAMSDIIKQTNSEVSEKPSPPMTKHTLIQMAVDRLKDMEEKEGDYRSNNDDVYHGKPSKYLITEVMEIMKNLKEDNLYVLQPVVEGDIIKVSDHPTMDGMNIIEFVEV